MITVTTYAIGNRYIKELPGWVKSIRRYSKPVQMIFGLGKPGESSIDVYVQRSDSDKVSHVYEFKPPVSGKLLTNWNNIGFLKPCWISAAIDSEHCTDTLLWVDVDARTRGNLNEIVSDLEDADLGLVYNRDHWMAGTIAAHRTEENYEWFKSWGAACVKKMRPHHNSWLTNDQTIMQNMISKLQAPPIIDLGTKWASIPPALVGDKKNPVLVCPTNDDAIIWHWQASRGEVQGWNWPPEEKRRKI